MRLVCPNCDAEYEVDASVIPDNGRDVQCSNCGNAWFQLPPEIVAEIEAEESLYEPPPPIAATMAATASPVNISEAFPEGPAAEDPPRRAVDESVLSILREEAERETTARRSEAAHIETQPDLGLRPSASGNRANAVAQRIAKMKGIDPQAAPAAPARPTVKRELLPEIEEINSTLRASNERREGQEGTLEDGTGQEMPLRKKSSGFRTGFVLMLLLGAIAVSVYVMAPRLSAELPALAAPLGQYVAAVDVARVFLDTQLQTAIDAMRGVIGSRT